MPKNYQFSMDAKKWNFCLLYNAKNVETTLVKVGEKDNYL